MLVGIVISTDLREMACIILRDESNRLMTHAGLCKAVVSSRVLAIGSEETRAKHHVENA